MLDIFMCWNNFVRIGLYMLVGQILFKSIKIWIWVVTLQVASEPCLYVSQVASEPCLYKRLSVY